MSYFDVRIPGLRMTVIEVDGQNIRPIEVDPFRIAPGETFDVLVQPEDRVYTVFAESMDRSGYTRGRLAPRSGMSAAIPSRRPAQVRTMADMGMGGMAGMEGGGKTSAGSSDMMAHPIHLHGMWMELENGAGSNQPRKHTSGFRWRSRQKSRDAGSCTATSCFIWTWGCSV